MRESDVLDAEYRAFVRQLHQQTIGIVAEVDRYWMQVLFREVTHFTAGFSTASTTRSSQLLPPRMACRPAAVSRQCTQILKPPQKFSGPPSLIAAPTSYNRYSTSCRGETICPAGKFKVNVPPRG
jgi:hypothetical protein